MKRMPFTSLLVALVAAVLVPISCGGGREADAQVARIRAPAGSVQGSSARALGVDELMRDADANRGEVLVEGVVSAVSAEPSRVALIDTAEFERCGVVTCAELALPVRWSGRLPELGSRVRVRGKVELEGEKLVFVAVSAEQVRTEGTGR